MSKGNGIYKDLDAQEVDNLTDALMGWAHRPLKPIYTPIEVAYPKGFEPEVRKCECRIPGEDDGNVTCWIHHDCSDGSCTHTDGDDDDYPEDEV